ncbi:hypothetical protein TBLA_0H03110 [Henningerozyma blattae CBS 6284]|uniref:Small ribosomal subunit protein mS35 mitochondrial conserved domain-containing protein n=1 Tax=Henningerozyma blattae (strain ATCC 34711 / CBS 6284 / DSM 70876 / NBRC 10599 / NRRL Y-10934 / UCD 77-7) TaxID=1071380 RepID=I2H890_HENB6|nr:hypothetical protein TBLA_0H03110 [Tetrapisispora blattae CBS 6284]CCH62592.1 hypothetical protein TBLA_0H03110 [Tetrapisispora blattae CBS 6284]
MFRGILTKPSSPFQLCMPVLRVSKISNSVQSRAFSSFLPTNNKETSTKKGITSSNKAKEILLQEKSTLPKFDFDELPSIAQDLVDQHREQRFYNRIAAYELPLLVKFRQEYIPPSTDSVLSFRYTTYPGEETTPGSVPAASKVVLTISMDKLKYSDKEKHKLAILSGTNYNPITKTFKFSCNKYQNKLENKYYLINIWNQLITELKDTSDMFEDVPIDKRYAQTIERRRKRKSGARSICAFPKEWERPEDAPKKLFNFFD